MRKLTRNAIRCTRCNVEIVSTHRHDFVSHTCMFEGREVRLFVDGGLDYGRIGFSRPDDYEDISTYADDGTSTAIEEPNAEADKEHDILVAQRAPIHLSVEAQKLALFDDLVLAADRFFYGVNYGRYDVGECMDKVCELVNRARAIK